VNRDDLLFGDDNIALHTIYIVLHTSDIFCDGGKSFLYNCLEFREATVDLFKTTVDLFKTTVDLFKTTVELFKATVELFKATVELFKTTVDTSSEHVQSHLLFYHPGIINHVLSFANCKLRRGPTAVLEFSDDPAVHLFDMTKISAARLNMEGGRIDNPILKAYGEKAVTATVGSTYTVDTTAGNVFYLTLGANCTFTFPSTLTSGVAYSFTLMLKQDGGTRTVTWPSSVNWPGSSTPVLSGTAGATDAFSFVTINGGTTWLGVAGGLNFGAAAASTTYALWAWGKNTYGNLGLLDVAHRSLPTQVGTLSTWAAAGRGANQVQAVKSDGTLWSWGRNQLGELGLADTVDRSSPVQLGGFITWAQVAGYRQTLAIKTDGTLWAWGQNDKGQLGSRDVVGRSSPVQVGTLTNWSSVSVSTHSLALKTDGTLWVWGENNQGQHGLADVNVNRSSPVQVGTLTTWSSISAGDSHTVGLKTDGTLWVWGAGGHGKLGLESNVYRSSPVQVGTLTTWASAAGAQNHTLAVKTDGTAWAWGYNDRGALGLGDVIKRSSPVQVGTLATWSLVAGSRQSLAIKTDGTLWAWGRNDTYGDLGLGDTADRSSPVQVGGGAAWAALLLGSSSKHTLALQDPSLLANSQLFSWGSGYKGQLGLGDAIARSSPVQVGTIATWSTFAAGYGPTRSGIKTDGTIWTWGYDIQGQLGLGDTIDRSSPVQVGALATWASVATSSTHAQAIKIDGTLWAWGYNGTYGGLGDGTLTNRSSPVQIGTLNTWSSVTVGGNGNSAIKSDSTLWSWGKNHLGALGLGTAGTGLTCSSPTQVGTLSIWRNVSAGVHNRLAVRTDGTLWAWGRNANAGQLGLGDIIDRSSPVQIGTLTTWSSIASSGGDHSLALKTDGTLWSWGGNSNGRLGLGDAIDRSSPVQVGTLSTWSRVCGGSNMSTALKTDGTLWAWGNGTSGEQGQGDAVKRSSPVQVGTLATWTSMAIGTNATQALLWPPTTTTTAPGKPTAVIATVGSASGTAVVVWTAPMSSGGKPISLYTVTSSPGGITATTNGTFATVTGLTPTTSYTFTVTATNSVGTGSASEASNAVVAP